MEEDNNAPSGVEEIAVRILGNENSQPGTVSIKKWSSAQRAFRAGAYFFAAFIAALLSILIPIAHFILVPVLLLVSVILPVFIYNKKSAVLGGRGKCPYCNGEFEIAASADRWPLKDICQSCHRHVSIERSA